MFAFTMTFTSSSPTSCFGFFDIIHILHFKPGFLLLVIAMTTTCSARG